MWCLDANKSVDLMKQPCFGLKIKHQSFASCAFNGLVISIVCVFLYIYIIYIRVSVYKCVSEMAYNVKLPIEFPFIYFGK